LISVSLSVLFFGYPYLSLSIVNDAAIETIPQDLLKKYLAYARSTCHPQIGSIDENKLVELYQELRRDSITAGGVPVAVRHIESIVRISEANAKMHLRDHVRNEDVDMAIRVRFWTILSIF
jgi:DNA replication licensing factor MCM2